MSLAKLPTELDTLIVSFHEHDTFDKGSLGASSNVSKYYRSIAEPLLYKRLKFEHGELHALRCLLITLLDRKDLAGYINSFTLMPQYFSEDPFASNEDFVRRKLWEKAGMLQDVIKDTIRSTVDSPHARKVASE